MAKLPAKYSRGIVQQFCDILSNTRKSIPQILAQNPEFPTADNLRKWRVKYPAVDRAITRASQHQAEYLMQYCLELASTADKTNAHAIRVQFDIYKFLAAKRLPAIYGDKPSETSVSVSNTVVIGAERLNAIRGNLERSRAQFAEVIDTKTRTANRKQLLPPELQAFDAEQKKRKVLKESTPKVTEKAISQGKTQDVTSQDTSPIRNGQTHGE